MGTSVEHLPTALANFSMGRVRPGILNQMETLSSMKQLRILEGHSGLDIRKELVGDDALTKSAAQLALPLAASKRARNTLHLATRTPSKINKFRARIAIPNKLIANSWNMLIAIPRSKPAFAPRVSPSSRDAPAGSSPPLCIERRRVRRVVAVAPRPKSLIFNVSVF